MIPAELVAQGWPAGVAAGFAWLLGPTVNAIRKNIGLWTDYQTQNLLHLAEKTQARSDNTTEDPGSVHPRVAQQVLAEASLTDDDLMQEYFAGMLIGARNPEGLEGDNAYYANIAGRLSSDQLRLHHILYATVAGLGTGNELRTTEGAARILAYIPQESLEQCVHSPGMAAMALHREQLLGEYVFDPDGDVISGWQPWVPGKGFAFRPTPVGAALFLKAYGVKTTNLNALLALTQLPRTKTVMPRVSDVQYGPTVVRGT